MMEILERAKLVRETEDGVGVHLLQRLQGDPLLPFAVERLVDDAHPAPADLPNELEAVADDLGERVDGCVDGSHARPALEKTPRPRKRRMEPTKCCTSRRSRRQALPAPTISSWSAIRYLRRLLQGGIDGSPVPIG